MSEKMQMKYQRTKPVEFLVQQLEKLKSARQTKKDYPSLFDESNLDAVFGILDPTKQGHITLRQYREALKTLGIKDFEMDPMGAENDKITLATFQRVARNCSLRLISARNSANRNAKGFQAMDFSTSTKKLLTLLPKIDLHG
ncbi:EF-hand calcium-binding domain-containing protein 10 [Rhincodon typus]|uniref:EF-hand calcium-binding domain-containing protein 10 n=1 Tax=Rhincodon typus TaxID=259920 RepID=UPI002030CACB|nr:EF-hand calcium-binding domain-containing protein 10 [Rhincodon typus]